MSSDKPKLILASRSPRRRQLLWSAGYSVEIVPPLDPAEPPIEEHEAPTDYVCRLACRKADDVARQIPAGLLLACDTVAVCGTEILGKPADRADARRILERLRGRQHSVLTGLCLWDYPAQAPQVAAAETLLLMEPLTSAQIEDYLDSGLWEGKAGAFGYQDRLGWLQIVAGSESNVVGLPLELLSTMLAKLACRN